MAYLGAIFFADMEGGGGQNYFHLGPRQEVSKRVFPTLFDDFQGKTKGQQLKGKIV